ncbi:MAG: ABC transporter ATP-binding protein [Anaerolineaceae bacterium]|jgi:putative ABC transport system ATP-binding protein|nr:ABC transporter ATP-binding protein [Anaerolineaceae bacterium]
MKNIIEINNVSKIYESGEIITKAVDNVSMQIKPGEFVGLVGPSGSGKTTMLAIIAALLSPTNGQVMLEGQEMGQLSEAERVKIRREKIGFTFQSNNLVPYLNVQENIELMLRMNGKLDRQGKKRAQELIDRLGLHKQRRSMPEQLSGGQKQRVAIARSLIHNPSVVLADEPTASLDSERAYQVVEIFADLIHEQGKAGIMVTHDLRMCQYADRIIEMKDGVIATEYNSRAEICDYIVCDRVDPKTIAYEPPVIPFPVNQFAVAQMG